MAGARCALVSFSFHIPHPDPPPRALFERLGIAGLEWVTPPDEDELSPGTYHLHVEGRSTRGIEVTWEDARLEIRILVGSSPEDFAASIAIAGAAARRVGARVEPEDRDAMPADRLEARYGAHWARAMVSRDALGLRNFVFTQGTLTLICPRRCFSLGYRIVSALDAAGPADTFPDRLLDAVRRMQYLDPRRYRAPEGVETPLPSGGRASAALWQPDRGYLFPPVQYIHLHALDGWPLFLPYAAVPELPGVRAVWADEHRLLVEPVPGEAWGALCAEAARHHVVPTGERPN